MNFEIDKHSFERLDRIKEKLKLAFFFQAIEICEVSKAFYRETYGITQRGNFQNLRVLEDAS